MNHGKNVGKDATTMKNVVYSITLTEEMMEKELSVSFTEGKWCITADTVVISKGISSASFKVYIVFLIN